MHWAIFTLTALIFYRMKFYIIAGEASGDLHGSNLVKAILKKDPHAIFRGWGGDLMQKQGVEIVKHYHELAFMGFVEVIANLRTILNNIDFCKKDITSWQPDALILVDYPGFNLRIAKFGHGCGFKIIYYISPQVWAWKQSRVHQIKKVVDLMLVILPFEKEFYRKFNYEVSYVGHPLLDAIEQDKQLQLPDEEDWRKNFGLDQRPIIAVVPGSRKQEVKVMLPMMTSVCKLFNDYQFVVAAAPSIPVSFYNALDLDKNVKIIPNQFYSILKHAKAALVTSGTATLETALFGVPEIVCYRGNAISFFIAKKMIKVKYISLVNLIMDREVVTELIQKELNTKNIAKELAILLNDEKQKLKIKTDYEALKMMLGNSGASDMAAQFIADFLKNSKEISVKKGT